MLWDDFRNSLLGVGGERVTDDMLLYTHKVSDSRKQKVFYSRSIMPPEPGLEIMQIETAFALVDHLEVDIRAVVADVGNRMLGSLGYRPGDHGGFLTLVMNFPLAPIDLEEFMGIMGPAQLLAANADDLERQYGGGFGELDPF